MVCLEILFHFYVFFLSSNVFEKERLFKITATLYYV